MYVSNEIGRLRPGQTVIDDLGGRVEMLQAGATASALCDAAAGIAWTRDPFDRFIVASAIANDLSLITKGARMRRHLSLAWWAD